MSKELRRTTILIGGLTAFLLGLGFARFKLDLHVAWLLLSIATALLLTRAPRKIFLIAVITCCFLGGWYRGTVYMDHLRRYEALFSRIPHVVIERTISSVQMLLMYSMLGTVTIVLWHKNRDKNDIMASVNEEV